MWGREVDGRVLTFHLAGINNQNFLMRDEQTGSYWQQISGRAIAGPLKGRVLPLVHSDEVSFQVYRAEHANGKVLAPVAAFEKEYEAKDWDKKVEKMRVVVDFPRSGLPMREQVFGVFDANASRAFPVKKVLSEKLVQDHLGTQAIILVTASDNASVRAFRNVSPARDFYRLNGAEANGALVTDAQTGSRWNFQGCATEGSERGRCLEPVRVVKDYWFNWRSYHPLTTVYGSK